MMKYIWRKSGLVLSVEAWYINTKDHATAPSIIWFMKADWKCTFSILLQFLLEFLTPEHEIVLSKIWIISSSADHNFSS